MINIDTPAMRQFTQNIAWGFARIGHDFAWATLRFRINHEYDKEFAAIEKAMR